MARSSTLNRGGSGWGDDKANSAVASRRQVSDTDFGILSYLPLFPSSTLGFSNWSLTGYVAVHYLPVESPPPPPSCDNQKFLQMSPDEPLLHSITLFCPFSPCSLSASASTVLFSSTPKLWDTRNCWSLQEGKKERCQTHIPVLPIVFRLKEKNRETKTVNPQN